MEGPVGGDGGTLIKRLRVVEEQNRDLVQRNQVLASRLQKAHTKIELSAAESMQPHMRQSDTPVSWLCPPPEMLRSPTLPRRIRRL